MPTTESPCKVVFCWRGVTGYMSACWRALAARPEVDVHVVSYRPETHPQRAAPFDFEALVADQPGLTVTLLDYRELHDPAALGRCVGAQEPEVVVLPGWTNAAARALVGRPDLRGARFALAMDTPWRGDWRQRAGRWWLRRWLRRIDRVVVPGERGWQYARRLGFAERQIHRGLYGVDEHALEPAYATRSQRPEGWPRRFLFVGRYAEVKGLDVLLEAYARYRDGHASPFELTCCGTGPLAERVRAATGVTDRGFVQPGDLPGVLAEHGALVLPSRYDPWPLAIVEACAAGLAVICTSACGSAVEVVRDEANGWIVPPADAEALAEAMGRAHARHAALPTMGRRSQCLAGPFGSELWAERWARMLVEMRAEGGPPSEPGRKTPAPRAP